MVQTVPTPAPAPVRPQDRLNPGDALNINQSLKSTSSEYTLVIQGDHNCVLYQKDKGPSWPQGASPGNLAENLLFRADGELGILTTFGTPKWQSGTASRGNGSSFFQVRDDGNMVIWTDGQIVWSSRTGPAYPVATKDRIVGLRRILSHDILSSANGNFTLTLGNDINLVLTQGSLMGRGLRPRAPLEVRSNTSSLGFDGPVSELHLGDTLLIGQTMLSSAGDYKISLLPSGYLQVRQVRLNTSVVYNIIPSSMIQDAHYLSLGWDMVLEIRGADNRSL
ncbi:hypothetical protein AK830_g9991 [Neonectria ditissima]|uniref:Bulb-type lectin domain-containing protein n=1 Tax=Neonectria ditissima TaxID=78410 RepID=A0A0P7ATU3_9HYPO|nr:hypothetical protein AK830_g9991 [Neonectria ditissima]